MNKYFQIMGISGLVFVTFGSAAYVFTGNLHDLYVQVHFGIGGLCLLAYLATQSRTLWRSLRRRSTRYGLHSVFYSLLFLAVLVLVNFLSARHHYRWDLTESKVYSLSPQSFKVIDQLADEIEIYGFFERGENQQLSDLLKSYAYRSAKIKFFPVDPDRRPELARKFKVQRTNTLHVQYGAESVNVTDPTEESITNAIVKLTRAGKKIIYYLTGHGELKPGDRQTNHGFAAAKEALENANFQLRELLLGAEEIVPVDASLLIVAAPEKPLIAQETQAIKEYLKSGGRLLVLLPPTGASEFKPLMREWGIEVGDDIVVDQVVRLFAGPSLGIEPIVDQYSRSHPITRDFRERTIFPMARSVEAAGALQKGVDVVTLAKTSATSWGETDVDGIFKLGKAALGPQDKKGPVSVAVAATADLKKPGGERTGDARLVVLGSSGIANNRFFKIYFNRDFFMNAVDWLAGEEELISIRPRAIRASRLQLTQQQANFIFYVSFLILPEFLLIAGLVVWWRRR